MSTEFATTRVAPYRRTERTTLSRSLLALKWVLLVVAALFACCPSCG